MAVKYLVFAAVVAVAFAVMDDEYDPNPQYQYSYSVQDPHTGDFKSQVETRNGDSVKGQYSLADSDGTKRIVDYAADPVSGFNAIVSKVPIAHGGVDPVVLNYAARPSHMSYAARHFATPYSHHGYNYPYGFPYHGLAHGYYGY